LGIGTASPTTVLDVNGTARLNGLTSINGVGVANTALAVYGNGNGAGNYVFRMYDASSVERFFLTASGNFKMSSATDTGTTGDDEKFRLALAFAPTSGTRNHYGLYITQTINQTGGSNGITRGLYVQPTLTAAADFRAIETTVGKVCLNTTSGNTMIGTTTDAGFKLDVNGTARINGLLTLTSSANLAGSILYTNQGGDSSSYFRNTSSRTVVNGGQITLSGGTVSVSATTNGANSDASAIFDVQSTVKDFLPPRMTTTQKNAIASPATGLVVYDTTLNSLNTYNGSSWSSGGTNIYTADGSLTGARTLTMNGFDLTLSGISSNKFFNTGNLVLGNTTDSGYKLDVWGTTRTQNLFITNGSVPTAPIFGGVLYTPSVGGREMLGMITRTGQIQVEQPHLAQSGVSMWIPAGNSTVITVLGNQPLLITGSAVAANVAAGVSTTVQTRSKRIEFYMTASITPGRVAGFRGPAQQWYRATVGGGFHFICRFGPSNGLYNTSSRMFVGMSGTSPATDNTDVNPSTLTNILGVGYDSTDVNLQLMVNSTSTTTKVNLGASFPVPTLDRTDMYELSMFLLPSSNDFNYTVKNLTNSAVASGQISANIPAEYVLLAPRGWCSSGGTGDEVGIALSSLYLENLI
jgi:hypothetical protein